jgi:heme a synthase
MSAESPMRKPASRNSAVTDRRYSKWLNRFAWLTCVATLLLICSGGMVTSKNVGLAVPDWPTTFGYNMFLFPISKWVGGILFEHTHRLMGSLVGLLTIILAVWLWLREERRWVRNLGVIAVIGVILQGILGGLRVTMMKDQIGIFHAGVAQAFLGLLVFIALVTTKFWRSVANGAPAVEGGVPATPALDYRGQIPGSKDLAFPLLIRLARIKTFAIAITVAIYVQLALGATMRHQHRDLSILDFPTANGAWIPDTSAAALAKINAWRDARALSEVSAFQIWLQMVHRFLALIIAIAIVAFCARVLRETRDFVALKRLSVLWIGLVIGQITLGAWVIWSNKAADVATAHVALGAVMLSFGVSISAICWRISGRDPAVAGRCPDARAGRPCHTQQPA